MRVQMRVPISGSRDGVDWPPVGGTIDLPADEAEHLCAAGLAIPAAAPEPEKAAAPKARSKRPAPETR